ncbi:MAG: ParB/RepB/Spo0J family partition protein [Planctomycetota bacterium]|jgi:hypothetical protein
MSKKLYTKKEYIEFIPEDFEPNGILGSIGFSGTPQYADSVYEVGVIQPVLFGKYRNKLYIIAGNRRCRSYMTAVERARDGNSKKLLPIHLATIDAVIYHGISPTNQAALSIIENEERSDNPVATFRTIQTLKDENKWDEVAELYRINKARLDKFNKYSKIDPVFLDAHLEGKIAKGNLEKIASLNSTRQSALKNTLKEKDKIVQSDIREAKSTQVARALRQMPTLPKVEVPQVEITQPAPPMYMVLKWDEKGNKPGTQPILAIDMTLLEAQNKRGNGDRIFKLVEV